MKDVREFLLSTYGDRPGKKGKAPGYKAAKPHSDRQLASIDEGVIKAVINAAPPIITHLIHSNPGVIDSALASIILFIRGPATKMYTRTATVIQLRKAFQDVMKPFLQQDTSLTFPDGFNNPALWDPVDKRDPVRLQEAHLTLNARIHEVAGIKWHEVVGRDGKPFDGVAPRVLKLLTV